MKTFEVEVTNVVSVTLDETKFDAEFMQEFSRYMFYVDSLEDIAKHIAYNFAANGADYFVEGVGHLEEMGVLIREHGWETEIR